MTPVPPGQASSPWSLVRRAHVQQRPESAAATRQQLVLRYAPALRRFVHNILYHSADADAAAQKVVARLSSGDFAGVVVDLNRFRDVLQAAVRTMVRQHVRHGTLPPGFAVDPITEEYALREWQQAWQTTVVDHVWATLKDEEHQNPGLPAYTVLRLRTLHPENHSDQLATRLAAITGKPIQPDAYRQMLRRARSKFAEALVDEIKMGLAEASENEVQDELAELGLLEYVENILSADKSR